MSSGNINHQKIVLLVDDDEFAREEMSLFLLAQGYSVLQAENGQKGLDVLKKTAHFPCLVVLDLAMPVMDGRGFLRQRALDPILRDIHVVVVSGNRPGEDRLEGIDAYLQKPVDVERLIDLIDEHC